MLTSDNFIAAIPSAALSKITWKERELTAHLEKD
jgi:hypothetical protein